MKIQKNNKRAKTILIVVLVVVFVLAGGAAYWYADMNDFFGRANKETPSSEKDDKAAVLSDSEPSTDDIGDSETKGEDKKPVVETDESGKKIAQIVIVDASQYDNEVEVRAGINNLAEEGGKCEFVFTKNGQTLTRTSQALFSGTDINCQTLTVPVSDFPSRGEWQMVVKYTSPTASGASQTKTVVIK